MRIRLVFSLVLVLVSSLIGVISAEQERPTAPPPSVTPQAPPVAPPPSVTPQAPPVDPKAKPAPTQAPVARPAAQPVGVEPPPGYVIGAEDVLSVVFYREKDLSSDVVVRPDGKISLTLVNDIQASGLAPEQLRANIEAAAAKFVEEPTVSVIVKAINSRRVYITGAVAKQGPYALLSPMTVLQLISMAGGLGEYAHKEAIRVIRTENNKPTAYRVNYDELLQGKNLAQDIELKPGDRVLVD